MKSGFTNYLFPNFSKHKTSSIKYKAGQDKWPCNLYLHQNLINNSRVYYLIKKEKSATFKHLYNLYRMTIVKSPGRVFISVCTVDENQS